jgi:hypothetical protein
MPSRRGYEEEDSPPDMKVPATILPNRGKDSVLGLSEAVIRLNLGEFDGDLHYAAVVYLKKNGHFIMLYREAGEPWSVDNFKILEKKKEDSLDIVDGDIRIQEFMNDIQGIRPVAPIIKKRRKQKTKTNNKKIDKKTRKNKKK